MCSIRNAIWICQCTRFAYVISNNEEEGKKLFDVTLNSFGDSQLIMEKIEREKNAMAMHLSKDLVFSFSSKGYSFENFIYINWKFDILWLSVSAYWEEYIPAQRCFQLYVWTVFRRKWLQKTENSLMSEKKKEKIVFFFTFRQKQSIETGKYTETST